jgi:cardiolipin synthase A/B
MFISLNLILTVYVVNLIIIFAIMTFEEKNLNSSLIWLFITLFLPFVGFLIYYIFGNTSKLKMLSKKYSLKYMEKKYTDMINKLKNKLESNLDINSNKEIINISNNNFMGIVTRNTDIKTFYNAKDKFKSLFEDIKNAKKNIYIEYYTLRSKDAIGRELVSLLEEKSKEGIEIKIIYDRFGSKGTEYNDFKNIIKNGGSVQRFLPSLFFSILTLNYRMHRKIVVIDDEIAYTGGINIGDEYLNKDEKIRPWRDTSIRIIGDIVYLFKLRFLIDFNYLLNQRNKNIDEIKIEENLLNNNDGKLKIQFLSNGPESEFKYVSDNYIKIISNSKKYVYIQTPYLIPGDNLLNIIRLAKQSGLDVKIIIPGIPDKKITYFVTKTYAEELIKYGVKIYLYNGFIHSKVLLSDDYITLMGTSNLDGMSFLLNYENDIIIFDENFTKENKNKFEDDLKNSKELKIIKIENDDSFFYKIKKVLVKIISPIL